MIDARIHSAVAQDVVTDLDPLIVTSPLQRSGTTLLQRLLCSAANALIYGERPAQELEFFLSIHTIKVQENLFYRDINQRKLERVLSGDVNDWILDVTPDSDGYLFALQKAAFSGVAYCRDFARGHGRPVWGFKYPAWSPAVLRMLRRLMPRTRLLFISRDLTAALRSAKAQHMLDTEQQLRQLCESWLAGMAYIMELDDDPAVLTIRYEDLVGQPEQTLALASAFSGAGPMDLSVLQRKINIWPGQEFAVQSGDGYIPPVELTDHEKSIVDEMLMNAEGRAGH